MNTLENNFSDLNSTREQNIPQINNQAAFISLKISHVLQSFFFFKSSQFNLKNSISNLQQRESNNIDF